MSLQTVCDRCGQIVGQNGTRLSYHGADAVSLDLCGPCTESLAHFLGGIVARMELEKAALRRGRELKP